MMLWRYSSSRTRPLPLYSSSRIEVQRPLHCCVPTKISRNLFSKQFSLQNHSFESPHSFYDHDPAYPAPAAHPLREPALTKHLTPSKSRPSPHILPPTTQNTTPVRATRLESGTRMSTGRRTLIAKKACTRCSTQKRRCDKAVPDCGLCTRYEN
jgi:hypothetical protein